MKIIKRFVLATIFCFALQVVQAQVSHPDTMVRKIFATLQAKDQNAFLALYPTGEQFSKFMRGIMEQAMKTEEVKKKLAEDENTKHMNIDSLIDAQASMFASPMMFAEMQKNFSKVFQKIVEKGEKKGVKWNQAKLTTYSIDTSESIFDKNDPNTQALQNSGIKNMKGVINFTVGDSAYQLAFDKVMFLPNEGGWFGAEFPQLARKGESLQPDPETDMVEGVDSVAAPVQKKAPSKSKETKPTAKSKTQGTKTPARKPKTKS